MPQKPRLPERPRSMPSLRTTSPLATGNQNASQALRRSSIFEKEHLRRALAAIEKDSFRYKDDLSKKPWLDGSWSKQRTRVAQIVRSQTFETMMGVVIVLTVVLMIFETNADASCFPEFQGNAEECPSRSSEIDWLQTCNALLLVVYTVECACRLYVERGAYVCNVWNMIDMFTMIAGWCSIILANVLDLSVLRILRVARLIRLGRLMISVPELYVLVSGLSSSFKAILFGSILLIGVIIVWSIIVVEFLHPINAAISYPDCERCPRGFATVFAASLTLFSQIVAGDQWSSISVPLAEFHPWTAPVMFFMMTTISLGVMNLILAVIVEKAAEARANNKERNNMKKEIEREAQMVELAVLCDALDGDNNGKVSLDEMLDGFDRQDTFFKLMEHMDIARDEVEVVFNVLSGKGTDVDYMEFCQHLSTFNKRDPLMIQSMIKYSVMELRHVLKQDVMEALRNQNQMLEEQLVLLSHVPSCAEAAQDLQKKRLLRQSQSEEKKQELSKERNSTRTVSSDASWTINLDHVNEALEAACMHFQSMEAELDELLDKAQAIPQKLLGQASQNAMDVQQVQSSSLLTAEHQRLKRGDRSMSSLGSSSSIANTLQSDAGTRFQDLLMDFQQSMQRHRVREEQLHRRSKDTVDSLSALMEQWNIVKQEL